MDMSAILPLLMNKMGNGNDKMNTLLKMAQGEKPDMGTVMNMAMARANKNPFVGIRTVADIASYEILGKLTRYFM